MGKGDKKLVARKSEARKDLKEISLHLQTLQMKTVQVHLEHDLQQIIHVTLHISMDVVEKTVVYA